MKKTNLLFRILSAVVCIVLIAVMGLVLTSCDKSKDDGATSSVTSSVSSTESTSSTASAPADGYGNAPTDIGNGKVSFIFRVTDKDGYDTLFRVYTNEKTVGAALQSVGLIEGEEGDYGLYVKKVNGIVANYNVDKSYWAFYINNEYALTGVDKTEVTPDAEYCFKVEK